MRVPILAYKRPRAPLSRGAFGQMDVQRIHCRLTRRADYILGQWLFKCPVAHPSIHTSRQKRPCAIGRPSKAKPPFSYKSGPTSIEHRHLH